MEAVDEDYMIIGNFPDECGVSTEIKIQFDQSKDMASSDGLYSSTNVLIIQTIHSFTFRGTTLKIKI